MENPYSQLIEVTVISAEGLLLNRKHPVKKNASVTVRLDPYNSRSTAEDKDGGSYPVWNQKMELEMPVNVRYMTLEAYSGTRLIGTAMVPVGDFSGGYLPENYLSFLSYRLRNGRGEKNGIVNLSIKVKAKAKAKAAVGGFSAWTGIPVGGKGSNQEIVTGIPVSYRYANL